MTSPAPQNDQKQLWGHHCLSEWCCPNRIENRFCICARNLDDMIESCDHDTRARPDPLEVLEKWIEQNKLYMEIPKYTSDIHPDNVEYVYGTDLLDIIKELRTTPDAVIARGKREGWWKE